MGNAGHTRQGKWSEEGVPHRGWVCLDVQDLEEPSALCAMCETAEIRYVHVMQHANYPEILEVGCVCAEHMAEDYVGPRQREQALRARARRRSTWQQRQWSWSRKGNLYLNTEGYNLTVYPVGPAWQIRVTNRTTQQSQVSRHRYATDIEAQDAALTALLWAKAHL
jgi:hypothetical protein